MGVMSCSRKDCTHIICDIYVPSIGYICSDCQGEFKTYLEKSDIDLNEPIDEFEINEKLTSFINTSAGVFTGNKLKIDNFFNNHTR